MKRETFILGLLALLSYFTPGESHHFQPKPHPYQRLQQPIYHRRHSQVSSIYPRYGQYPRYFYVSQKQQAQKPQILPIQTPWQRVCPPGYTARLLHYHYSRFLCIPNKQLTSDKIETKHRPQKYLLHLSLAPQQPYLHQLTLLTALPLLLHQVPPSKLQLCHLFNRCFSGFRCTLVKVGWDGMVSKLSEQFYLLG
ncbi:mucin 10, submandibular gland salivary mucin, isoform CRA_a [Rattus norvegicus]|uniref:Mucin 10, submandibular gland salivary mucin, isoform CRA_a n=1 Tax=Rattus norvegicus TaxID=10116 RepID=A6KKK1_RAT|nr:mucin 10, submandibular gland salivary mucin, isoform CRA_a [Rattus norvegicus]